MNLLSELGYDREYGARPLKRVIQNKDVVLLDDIYHVVEHFGYHTGQIIYIVKALKQQPFKWYKKLDKTP